MIRINTSRLRSISFFILIDGLELFCSFLFHFTFYHLSSNPLPSISNGEKNKISSSFFYGNFKKCISYKTHKKLQNVDKKIYKKTLHLGTHRNLFLNRIEMQQNWAVIALFPIVLAPNEFQMGNCSYSANSVQFKKPIKRFGVRNRMIQNSKSTLYHVFLLLLYSY